MRVLITSAGSTPAQILARHIENDPRVDAVYLADIKPSGNCATPHVLNGTHFYYQVPKSDHEKYPDIIKDILTSGKIDLVIPTLPADIIALHGKIPEDKITTTKDSVLFCDKRKTAEAFFAIGIPQPKIYASSTPIDEVELPVIAKPLVGMGGTGLIIIKTLEEYYDFITERGFKKYHVQEYIEDAKEYTTDVVCDRKGRILGMCTRERIETKNGLCTIAETVMTDPVIEEYIREICRVHKFFGQINIQYLVKYERKYNHIYFLEVNPRLGGSSEITYRAGMFLAGMILDAALGEVRTYKKPVIGLRMLRYWREVYI